MCRAQPKAVHGGVGCTHGLPRSTLIRLLPRSMRFEQRFLQLRAVILRAMLGALVPGHVCWMGV